MGVGGNTRNRVAAITQYEMKKLSMKTRSMANTEKSHKHRPASIAARILRHSMLGVGCAVFTLLLSGSAVLRAADASLEKPNIVLIFVDDLGYGGISPFGNQKFKTPTVNPPRLEWSTLDPREANNADLAPLMRSLRDARVVLLGEVHSDGASYSQKTRLVRALHEELGFGVVAFETSAFDMWQLRRRWPRLRDAAEVRASHGSNPLWARARDR